MIAAVNIMRKSFIPPNNASMRSARLRLSSACLARRCASLLAAPAAVRPDASAAAVPVCVSAGNRWCYIVCCYKSPSERLRRLRKRRFEDSECGFAALYGHSFCRKRSHGYFGCMPYHETVLLFNSMCQFYCRVIASDIRKARKDVFRRNL